MGASQSQESENNGQQQYYRSDSDAAERPEGRVSDGRAAALVDRRGKEAHHQQHSEGRAQVASSRNRIATTSAVERDGRRKDAHQPQLPHSEGRAKAVPWRMEETPPRGYSTASAMGRDERRTEAHQPQLPYSEGRAKAVPWRMEETPPRGYATASAVGRDERRTEAYQPQLHPSEAKGKTVTRRMEETPPRGYGTGTLHPPPRGYGTGSAVYGEEKMLPYNLEAILREADTPVDRSSPEKLFSQLYTGVLVNQKRKKYWLDKRSNKNCFMLFARDLQITWAEDIRYWAWKPQQDTSNESIDAAELLSVCWLEVHGRFDTRKLSPETLYEVVFVVMMKEIAYGWDAPVSLRLTLPNGIKHEHKVCFMEKPKGQWMEIPVGEFKTSQINAGEIEFSMYEYECGDWKKGLVIKGAVIRPKN